MLLLIWVFYLKEKPRNRWLGYGRFVINCIELKNSKTNGIEIINRKSISISAGKRWFSGKSKLNRLNMNR